MEKDFNIFLEKTDTEVEEMATFKEYAIDFKTGEYIKEGNDIKVLEENGVEIVSCGACLDFYNLKESVKVGSIGNMYDIVDSLNKSTNKLTI